MKRPIITPPAEDIGLLSNAQEALADGDADLIEHADKAVAVRPIGPYIRLRRVSGSPRHESRNARNPRAREPSRARIRPAGLLSGQSVARG
jgi:hypothetical protein